MRAMSLLPSAWAGRPTWAEIDLDALSHNVRILVARAAPARVWAVVKANAYGHGAVACGQAALAAGASGLAVVCVDEGEELRRAGITAPIISRACAIFALLLRPAPSRFPPRGMFTSLYPQRLPPMSIRNGVNDIGRMTIQSFSNWTGRAENYRVKSTCPYD